MGPETDKASCAHVKLQTCVVSVLSMADRMPANIFPDENMDVLREEFSDYQLSTDLPSYDKTADCRLESIWGQMGDLTHVGERNLCETDFSISSDGRTDVRRHQESASHAKLAKSKGSTKGRMVQYVAHGQNDGEIQEALPHIGDVHAGNEKYTVIES